MPPGMSMEDPYAKWNIISALGLPGCVKVGDRVRIQNGAKAKDSDEPHKLFTGLGIKTTVQWPFKPVKTVIIDFATYIRFILDKERPGQTATKDFALGVAWQDAATIQNVFVVRSPDGLPTG
eukprot:CAMPEP_0203753982 /NCGR_PEP_ID=MMETSP0098-20131031/7658_1 /ASSEMBLY_ACC=CAM_ASM_000208 /TAXON_ID=96639 /ORGANISM=" , Strain NY0313808BC1" /LENGTH=121 /DNA_ID=CAMNT_0050644809 /DNA_START=27 /DNA_END=389 /DNA_ORIENTATION=+